MSEVVVWLSPIFRNNSEENLLIGSAVVIEPKMYFSIDSITKKKWKIRYGFSSKRFPYEQGEHTDKTKSVDITKISEEQLNQLKTCEVLFQLTLKNDIKSEKPRSYAI